MNDIWLHEAIYRGRTAVNQWDNYQVTLCGAGAIGSLLADNLVRQGVTRLRVIDDDRVEIHNAGTQIYKQSDIGGWKIELLHQHCLQAAGVEIERVRQRLTAKNVHVLLQGSDIIIDSFDNHYSRGEVSAYAAKMGVPCLHLGLNADYGQAHWQKGYRVPRDVVGQDVCDYPLARNLILMVVAIGSELLWRYLLAGEQVNAEVTLKDLKVSLRKE